MRSICLDEYGGHVEGSAPRRRKTRMPPDSPVGEYQTRGAHPLERLLSQSAGPGRRQLRSSASAHDCRTSPTQLRSKGTASVAYPPLGHWPGRATLTRGPSCFPARIRVSRSAPKPITGDSRLSFRPGSSQGRQTLPPGRRAATRRRSGISAAAAKAACQHTLAAPPCLPNQVMTLQRSKAQTAGRA